MAVINMDHEEFRTQVEGGGVVLVDFWAPWCGYCRRIAPAYEKVAEQYAGDMTVARVNIDDEPDLARREMIEVLPTLVLYRDGEAIGSIVAPESRSMIDTFIRESLEG